MLARHLTNANLGELQLATANTDQKLVETQAAQDTARFIDRVCSLSLHRKHSSNTHFCVYLVIK